RQSEPEIGEHPLRIDDRARAVRRRFVPDGRQPQHFPRVAGAQGADDEVVDFGRVLERDQMRPDRADMSERIRRLGRVFEQALLEVGIDPGARHDARAVMRADLRLARLDDRVERGRLDIAFLGQDRFERPHPQLQVGQLRHLSRAMRVGMGMRVVRHRNTSLSSRATLTKTGVPTKAGTHLPPGTAAECEYARSKLSYAPVRFDRGGGAGSSCRESAFPEEPPMTITKFDSLFAGHVDIENVGYGGVPVNDRVYANEHLASVFDKAEAMAKLMDRTGYNTFWMA